VNPTCTALTTKESTPMKISARNILKGTVKHIEPGAVNAEITVALPSGQELVSIITMQSVRNLELAPGKVVYSVIKASNVMLGVDH
jgi:molybdate transport system regulatory protein